MGAVSGLGTTHNLPNFTGELIQVTPQDTPFLSAISGLSAENFVGTIAGCAPTQSTVFQWQTTDLRDADATRQRLEGADAPTAGERTRGNVFNVVEIHQEKVSLSYSKLAATGQYATTGSNQTGAAGLNGMNPVANEMAFQLNAQFAQIARDIEKGFISGTFQDPADNTTARKTRGLLAAISTNTLAAAGALLSADGGDLLLRLMHMVWAAGGISDSGTAVVMCNGFQKRQITKAFGTDHVPDSRTVGGVSIDTIVTDFGTLGVMLDRHMPTGEVAVVSLEQCQPVVLNIPDKGVGFFVEDLAKTGSSENKQIYGEIGLKYGNEKCHGKITGLATSVNGAS